MAARADDKRQSCYYFTQSTNQYDNLVIVVPTLILLGHNRTIEQKF